MDAISREIREARRTGRYMQRKRAAAQAITIGYERVINNTGSTISQLAPVYISGRDTTADLPEITLSDNDVAATMPADGIVYSDIDDGDPGIIVQVGLIGGVDTSSYSIGDPLYVDSTAGQLTNTRPTGSSEVQAVCTVRYVHATQGIVRVHCLPVKDFDAALGGDVTAAAVMTDHTIVRGDGGGKGVQDTGATIDDSDNMDVPGTVRGQTLLADGDAGGTATTAGFTNGLDTNSASPAVGLSKRNGNASSAHQGWLKIYIGTTAAYIPYYD